MRKLLSGIGYIGIGEYSSKDEKLYNRWANMIRRCYSEATQNKHQTYIGCSVSKEWHNFQNFAEWYVAQNCPDETWQLDKDILVKDNKIYSSETCCLLPRDLNMLTQKRKRGEGLPVGVTRHKDKFRAQLRTDKWERGSEYLGLYLTKEDAFGAYLSAKKKRMYEKTKEWEHLLPPHVVTALLNYDVEITD
jgi:hypothetical protein